MSIQYAPKIIEHFCYCVGAQTEHKYRDRFELSDGDGFKYECVHCNTEHFVRAGELEILIDTFGGEDEDGQMD